MEKSKKNKKKDRAKISGKEWVYIPTTFKRRKTGSGITFDGKYVSKNSR